MDDYKERWNQWLDEGLAAGLTFKEACDYADDKDAEYMGDQIDGMELLHER